MLTAKLPAPEADMLAFANLLANRAREVILPMFRQRIDIDNKLTSGFDPVTEADRAAERALRELIADRFPEHGVDGEEYGAPTQEAEWTWVLDPIDGTRAFISGLPTWGVLIGLCQGGRPVLGVIDQPYVGERWRGWPGGADFQRDGNCPLAISTRPCGALEAATLCTTDPTLFEGADLEGFEALRARVRLTRYGLDCYAYAMLAGGTVDLVVEAGLKRHDVAALIPVIRGAGGAVSDWFGADPSDGGRLLAAGDRAILTAAEKQLQLRSM
jgi:histidinol phosphatase-like enzyme (inositol monophosphatase family)